VPGEEYASSELRRCSGKQFDPDVVKKILSLLCNQNETIYLAEGIV